MRAREGSKTCIRSVPKLAGIQGHEWIPIRVGTDGALALGLVNSLLNEHGIYDAEYLMYKTNGPYLIRPSDGRYMRDKETNKPLVWDLADNCPKVHNDPSVTRVDTRMWRMKSP